jgi:hypothetical protein
VFPQVYECEHNGESKVRGEGDTNYSPSANISYRHVTASTIQECAVREERRGVWVERKDTIRPVRQSAIGVVYIVPSIEHSKIEMYAGNFGIARVGAAGKCQQLTNVYEWHGAQ